MWPLSHPRLSDRLTAASSFLFCKTENTFGVNLNWNRQVIFTLAVIRRTSILAFNSLQQVPNLNCQHHHLATHQQNQLSSWPTPRKPRWPATSRRFSALQARSRHRPRPKARSGRTMDGRSTKNRLERLIWRCRCLISRKGANVLKNENSGEDLDGLCCLESDSLDERSAGTSAGDGR